MKKEPWDVIVVGAGLAGLSAATALAARGKKVLVLERRPILGGRASSFTDHTTGETVDNGQHLFLGCYLETKEYLRRIGALAHLIFHDSFEAPMAGPNGERALLKTASLPAPLHMVWALLGYRALGLKDRLRTFRVARAARKPDGDLSSVTVSEWLGRLGQGRESRERLWDPIVLAALNIHPDRAPADLLATVLREGFLASREASKVGLADVGLSDLHGEPSMRFLAAKGSEVRMRTAVKSVDRSDGIWNIGIADAPSESARALILAVPPPALLKLFATSGGSVSGFAEPAKRLTSSPILSLHVWFDREPFEAPFVGFWGQEFHWVFRKNSRHFSLVVSAAERMFEKSKAELVETCEREVRAFSGRECRVEHAVVVREAEATWVPPLGPPSGRLKTETPFENLFLAGDWTDTGLPATIESAIRSGHRAAEAVD